VPIVDGAAPVARWREPNYVVELDRVREAGDFATLLGQRTRKNMRRSRRSYEARGPLRLRVAETVDEADAFLDRLTELHEATWRARGWPGNFADPAVLAFHRDLVRCRVDAGEVQLARITAGRDEIGYLYSLVYRDRVIGYDMGLRYENDPALQPGRMCDWLAIEHYAAQGYAIYDNLSGDTQFKRSLGTRRDEIVWLLVRRDRLFDRAEEAARRAFIVAVRDTAAHRWQRRLRIAVSARVESVPARVRAFGRSPESTGPDIR
jgi:CelD/BcsL family acetyltransferase involved in cellulose biosynthesis